MKLSTFERKIKIMEKVNNYIKSFPDYKTDFVQIGVNLLDENDDYDDYEECGILESSIIDIEIKKSCYQKYFIEDTKFYLPDLENDIIVYLTKEHKINKNLKLNFKTSIKLFKAVYEKNKNEDRNGCQCGCQDILYFKEVDKKFDYSFLDQKTNEDIIQILLDNNFKSNNLPKHLQDVALFMNKD